MSSVVSQSALEIVLTECGPCARVTPEEKSNFPCNGQGFFFRLCVRTLYAKGIPLISKSPRTTVQRQLSKEFIAVTGYGYYLIYYLLPMTYYPLLTIGLINCLILLINGFTQLIDHYSVS